MHSLLGLRTLSCLSSKQQVLLEALCPNPAVARCEEHFSNHIYIKHDQQYCLCTRLSWLHNICRCSPLLKAWPLGIGLPPTC